MLSFDQFRAVIASPPHRAEYGLEVSPATLALLGTDESTAQSFYNDWTRDGQPRLSATPVQAPVAPTYAAPVAVAPQPIFAPPAAVAPEPTHAPPVAIAPAPAFAAPAAVAPEPTFAPSVAIAPEPTYAPPVIAPQPTYAPPSTAVAAQPAYAAPAAAPSYAPAFPQFSRDPQVAAGAAPASYSMAAPAQAHGSGSGLRNILIGFGIALVGTIITIASFNASGPGGTFVVAWGAIIFGAIQGIRGIVQLLKA